MTNSSALQAMTRLVRVIAFFAKPRAGIGHLRADRGGFDWIPVTYSIPSP
ncbi:MAG: hypothetical protein JWO52_1233 [Gammaproteobacteria bacterium]|nr:hypothetical protein [Gammaproteobacteria bacterium]